MMNRKELDKCLTVEVNQAVEAALPKSLLVHAFVDALASIETVDELMAMTGLPRVRAAEILNLRQLLTNCASVRRH